MASSKTFTGVTPTVWECVKTTSASEHGTVYAPPGADTGTATTDTIVGKVVLGYVFTPATATVVYTIQKKPALAPESSIWSGIQDTINGCSGA